MRYEKNNLQLFVVASVTVRCSALLLRHSTSGMDMTLNHLRTTGARMITEVKELNRKIDEASFLAFLCILFKLLLLLLLLSLPFFFGSCICHPANYGWRMGVCREIGVGNFLDT